MEMNAVFLGKAFQTSCQQEALKSEVAKGNRSLPAGHGPIRSNPRTVKKITPGKRRRGSHKELESCSLSKTWRSPETRGRGARTHDLAVTSELGPIAQTVCEIGFPPGLYWTGAGISTPPSKRRC